MCLQVALDVKVGERLGRLVLGLYGNVVPKTVSGDVVVDGRQVLAELLAGVRGWK